MKIEVTVANAETHAELFGKRLCEAVELWEVCNRYNTWMFYCWGWIKCESLTKNASLFYIHEAEKAVIERVSHHRYGEELVYLITENEIDYVEASLIATADAKTRLVACLLSLGINEIEVEG